MAATREVEMGRILAQDLFGYKCEALFAKYLQKNGLGVGLKR
jgi:hypothetical protein